MNVVFANPAGWWLLLGLPAVLAIHFLQRKSRRMVVSTLFLLERVGPVSAQGRRVERLRSSLPLWLQLLAVLLMSWLCAGPRWMRSDSAQTVVVVLDSSISMQVWRKPLLGALKNRLEALSRSAAHTEWILMESDLTKPTVYTGSELSPLLERFDNWTPSLGAHEVAPALRVAQSLMRKDGLVIFATDHAQALPEGVRMLAVGVPFDNVGFIGLRVENGRWTALLQNHGSTSQTRSWWLESGGQAGPRTEVTLGPGQTQALSGNFPASDTRQSLVLTPDLFPVDDRLPLVRPQPKEMGVAIEAGTPLDAFFQHFGKSLPGAKNVDFDHADLRVVRYNPLAPKAAPPASIDMLADPAPSEAYLSGTIVASDHPLVEGLNWQGLLCRDTLTMPGKPGDEVLLWQGDRPLIWLRGDVEKPSLVVNFDIRQSNADRLPAFVILLNRFAEALRSRKVAPERGNVETNQLLDVAARKDAAPPEVVPDTGVGGVLRAPGTPGFFEVRQAGTTLLQGAAHFADPREADFREMATLDTIGDAAQVQSRRSSREDFLAPLWTLLLGVLLMANWHFVGRGRVV